MNSRTLKWTNLLVFLVTVAMNAVAVLLPLAGRTTQEISQMKGTPSTFVFGADGALCLHQFGHLDDLAFGLFVGQQLSTLLPQT